jgi:hypothetical protein
MADASTKATTKQAPAKSGDAAKETAPNQPETTEQVIRGDQGATLEAEKPQTATGADRAMVSTDGEERPKEFGANAETFESATWAQTHGENPLDAPRGDY